MSCDKNQCGIPVRLVSLMELLQIYVDLYVKKANTVALFVKWLEDHNLSDPENESTVKFMVRDLEALRDICLKGDLPMTNIPLESALYALKHTEAGLSNQALCRLLDRATDRLADELSTKLFLQIPHSRKYHFNDPLKGWERVVKRFEECSRDVEEMNKCFALSRYSAAMFHALHVAEWGAIALGDHIGVSDSKKGWGPTSKKLAQLIDCGHNALPTNLIGQFPFLEQVNREIETMKLAWRHKIDHAANSLTILPNTEFTPDVTEHIMQSVKVFMTWLMENLK